MNSTLSKLLSILSLALLLVSCSNSEANPDSQNQNVSGSEKKIIEKTNAQSYSIWFPLVRADWTLKNITYGGNEKKLSTKLKSGLPASKVKLSFRRGGLGFHSGCNGHGGTVKLRHENKMAVSDLISTVMGCSPILQDGESEFSKHLRSVERYEVVGTQDKPQLVLITKENTKLKLNGELTPETKYGTPKSFILEVKIWRKSDCLDKRCVQWRKVKFNENNKGKSYDYRKQWLPIKGKNFWNYSWPDIKKFKPEKNRRHILRVKEFKSEKLPKGILWVNNGIISSARLED